MTWSTAGTHLRRLKGLGTVYLYRYENDNQDHDRQSLSAIKFAVALIEEVRENLDEQAWAELVARARTRPVRFPETATLRAKRSGLPHRGPIGEEPTPMGFSPVPPEGRPAPRPPRPGVPPPEKPEGDR